MTSRTDEMQPHAAREDGQPAGQSDRGTAAPAGGSVAGAASLLPALADLQRRMVDVVRHGGQLEAEAVIAPPRGGMEERSQQPQNGREQLAEAESRTPGLTLVVGRDEMEKACAAVYDTVLDGLFSDRLRARLHKDLEQTLGGLIAATRKARPGAAALREAQRQAEECLGRAVEATFSPSARDEARRDSRKITAALLQGDVPAARKQAQRLVESVAGRRTDLLQEQWGEIFQSFIALAIKASRDKAAPKKTSSDEAVQHEDTTHRPQTIERSDKRAQDIWDRAYARAAREHGEGHKAERAAYDALHAQYEKKGDRWVKKSKAE